MRKKIEEFGKKFYTETPNKFEWILAGIAFFLVGANMFYGDNIAMFLGYFWNNTGFLNWSTGSLEWLGNNRLPYGIVQQIIGQVWCLPVNICYKLFGPFEPANIWTVWWYKIIIMIFYVLCIKEMCKLADKAGITKNNSKWMIYIFTTSLLVCLPVLQVAQCDAIYMFFALKGINYYLEDDYWKFLIFMMLSIDCKYMAIFMFIPLVLLKEKRLLFIVRDLIVGVILIPLQMVWYKIVIILDKIKRPDTGVKETGEAVVVSGNYSMSTVADNLDSEYAGFMSHFYHKTLYFEIPAIRKEYFASALIVLFMLLCIWCFIRKKDENRLRDVLFAGFLSMTLLYAMSSPNPYWIVAMYPVTFIMMYAHPEKIRINLLLQLGYSLTMFLVYLDSMPFVFGGTTNFNYTPLSVWFHVVRDDHTIETGPTVYGFLSKLGIPSLMPVIVAVCLACLIAWVIINLPTDRIKVEDNVEEKEVLKFHHGLALFQSATIIIWFVLCAYCLSRY